MKLRTRTITLIGFLILALVACRPAAQPTTIVVEEVEETEQAEEKDPTPTPTYTSPQATPTQVAPPQSPLSTPPANPAAAAALAHLADELGLAPQVVTILSIEEVQWSDGSLGCPQPGMAYIQVVIPGYRITLEANGETYDVHTDESGSTVVVCDLEAEEFSGAAIAHLADELGLAPQDVTVLSIEEVQWSDGSLGCPQPGMAYIQVVIPGYRITLEANGETYDVHTDESGSTIVVCDLEAEEFSGPGVAFKTLLAGLTETHPGFGLEQQQEWTSQDITKGALLGSSTWVWKSGEWALEMTFPPSPEPAYDTVLFHQGAGTIWNGRLEPDGSITHVNEPIQLSFSAGECDESITPSTNPEWAKTEITVQGSDILVEQNLSYVCCAELEMAVGRSGSVIKLIETNVGEVCRCMCGYPVTARLTGLAAGTYTVEVWGVQHLDVHPLELLGRSQVQIS